ncbi:hypothetical protein TYM08_P1856 [Marinicellulosiphila megalodicopiae]
MSLRIFQITNRVLARGRIQKISLGSDPKKSKGLFSSHFLKMDPTPGLILTLRYSFFGSDPRLKHQHAKFTLVKFKAKKTHLKDAFLVLINILLSILQVGCVDNDQVTSYNLQKILAS